MKKSLSVLMSALMLVSGSNLSTKVFASGTEEDVSKYVKSTSEGEERAARGNAEEECKAEEKREREDYLKKELEKAWKDWDYECDRVTLLRKAIEEKNFAEVQKILEVADYIKVKSGEILGGTIFACIYRPYNFGHFRQNPLLQCAIENSTDEIVKALLSRVEFTHEEVEKFCRIAVEKKKERLVDCIKAAEESKEKAEKRAREQEEYKKEMERREAEKKKAEEERQRKEVKKTQKCIDSLRNALNRPNGIDFLLKSSLLNDIGSTYLAKALSADKEIVSLIIKAENSNPRSADLLKKIFAKIDWSDATSISYRNLECAVQNNSSEMLKILIHKISTSQIAGDDYRKLIGIAVDNENEEIVSILTDAYKEFLLLGSCCGSSEKAEIRDLIKSMQKKGQVRFANKLAERFRISL